MAKNFFITGLGRTRTAWLSNLFTLGNVACMHDGTARFPTRGTYVEHLQKDRHVYAGDSNSGLLLAPEILLEDFKDSPLVIVERPLPDVHSSFMAAFGNPGMGQTLNARLLALQGVLSALKHRPNTMIVPFDALDSAETLREVWGHCAPRETFPEEHARRLNGFSITVHREKYLAPIIGALERDSRHWAINPGGASCH